MKKFLNKNKTTLTLFGAGVSSLVASYLFTCGAHSAPANSIIEAFLWDTSDFPLFIWGWIFNCVCF